MGVFKTAEGLYQNFLRSNEKIKAELQKVKSSGDFSAKKINEMETNARYDQQKNKEILLNQFARLREQYETELLKGEDFTELSSGDMAVLGKLGSLLHSGISFTRQEYSRMAQKYGSNRACSRLLHDDAKAHGLHLDNMRGIDEKMQKLEWALDRYEKAISLDDAFQRDFLIDFTADQLEKELETPSYSCSEIPADWDGIARAVSQSMSVSGGASPHSFIAGFLGADKAKELEEIEKIASDPEKMRFDALSEIEQAFTMELTKLGGEYGNLTHSMNTVEKVVADLQAAKLAKE